MKSINKRIYYKENTVHILSLLGIFVGQFVINPLFFPRVTRKIRLLVTLLTGYYFWYRTIVSLNSLHEERFLIVFLKNSDDNVKRAIETKDHRYFLINEYKKENLKF